MDDPELSHFQLTHKLHMVTHGVLAMGVGMRSKKIQFLPYLLPQCIPQQNTKSRLLETNNGMGGIEMKSLLTCNSVLDNAYFINVESIQQVTKILRKKGHR
jgi:hypothetical protein